MPTSPIQQEDGTITRGVTAVHKNLKDTSDKVAVLWDNHMDTFYQVIAVEDTLKDTIAQVKPLLENFKGTSDKVKALQDSMRAIGDNLGDTTHSFIQVRDNLKDTTKHVTVLQEKLMVSNEKAAALAVSLEHADSQVKTVVDFAATQNMVINVLEKLFQEWRKGARDEREVEGDFNTALKLYGDAVVSLNSESPKLKNLITNYENEELLESWLQQEDQIGPM
ncbi:hypothetical protein BDR22DRAFT_243030 [Usnea florida]